MSPTQGSANRRQRRCRPLIVACIDLALSATSGSGKRRPGTSQQSRIHRRRSHLSDPVNMSPVPTRPVAPMLSLRLEHHVRQSLINVAETQPAGLRQPNELYSNPFPCYACYATRTRRPTTFHSSARSAAPPSRRHRRSNPAAVAPSTVLKASKPEGASMALRTWGGRLSSPPRGADYDFLDRYLNQRRGRERG